MGVRSACGRPGRSGRRRRSGSARCARCPGALPFRGRCARCRAAGGVQHDLCPYPVLVRGLVAVGRLLRPVPFGDGQRDRPGGGNGHGRQADQQNGSRWVAACRIRSHAGRAGFGKLRWMGCRLPNSITASTPIAGVGAKLLPVRSRTRSASPARNWSAGRHSRNHDHYAGDDWRHCGLLHGVSARPEGERGNAPCTGHGLQARHSAPTL